MGLAIDGNIVHGIAKGGQAFVSLEDANDKDGSINIGGQYYLSTKRIEIQDINGVSLGLSQYVSSSTTDVTSQLSEHTGHWAILTLHGQYGDDLSQPFIIPTTPTTENLSIDNNRWTVSLSRDTDNRFTLNVSIDGGQYASQDEEGRFCIISN